MSSKNREGAMTASTARKLAQQAFAATDQRCEAIALAPAHADLALVLGKVARDRGDAGVAVDAAKFWQVAGNAAKASIRRSVAHDAIAAQQREAWA
jgi:hypothetical protein